MKKASSENKFGNITTDMASSDFCVLSLLLDIHFVKDTQVIFSYSRVRHAGLMKNENAAKRNVKNTSIKTLGERDDRSQNSLLFNYLGTSKAELHTNLYSSFSSAATARNDVSFQ